MEHLLYTRCWDTAELTFHSQWLMAQGYQQRAKRGINVGPGLGSLGRLLGEGQDIHAGILKYELGLAGVVRSRK